MKQFIACVATLLLSRVQLAAAAPPNIVQCRDARLAFQRNSFVDKGWILTTHHWLGCLSLQR